LGHGLNVTRPNRTWAPTKPKKGSVQEGLELLGLRPKEVSRKASNF
jgi:hypothetical protein